jgi:hypothetical protein
MNSALDAGIALALWGNLLYKLRRFRGRPRHEAQRATCVTLLFMALTFTFLIPPIYAAIDGLTGIPNLARLLGNGCGVVAACAFEPVATELSEPGSGRRGFWGSWWLMAVTLVLMTGLFFRAALPASVSGAFPRRYDMTPAVGAYRLIFLGYIGLILCRLFVLWRRRFGAAIEAMGYPTQRREVRLQTVGWALGAAYCTQECGYILLRATGAGTPSAYSPVLAYGLLAGCFALILSDGFFSFWDWTNRYRTYRALTPLWRDLFAVVPGIALDPSRPGWAHIAALGDLDFRLSRRVTEIHDGVMTLQPYLDQTGIESAHRYCHTLGVTREAMREYIEAFTLAAAIEAKYQERRARHPLAEPLLPNSTDLDAETRHLRGVATAYRQVARVVKMMEGAHAIEAHDDERGMMTPRALPPHHSRRTHVARVLTEVFAPSPVGVVALVLVAWRFSPTLGDAVRWMGLCALFVVILPFTHLAWQVHRGRVTDIHVRRREQRLPIILVFLVSWLALIPVLVTLDAPHELIALIGAGITALVVTGAITLRWKISLHVGVAAGVLTVLALLFGPGMLALVPLLPLIGWARMELRDHTFLQVFAGGLIGGVASGGAFMIALTFMHMPT